MSLKSVDLTKIITKIRHLFLHKKKHEYLNVGKHASSLDNILFFIYFYYYLFIIKRYIPKLDGKFFLIMQLSYDITCQL